MFHNLFSFLLGLFYYFCIVYLFFIEFSYFYLKHIKKDVRFEKIRFFKYLECPIKTLKGDK